MLTGFRPVDDVTKQKADQSTSISLGNSPFQHNVKFKVTDYGYRKAENDGKVDKDAYTNPVLTTTVGDLFLSMLIKARVKANGDIISPNGTFNVFVKDTITANSGKSNGEILKAIVDGCKGKELIVERVPYSAKSKDGREYAASAVNINFAE